VQLFGSNLANGEQSPEVTFNGEPVALAEWDSDRMSVDLPHGATSGALDVVFPGGEALSFEVTAQDGAPSDAWAPEGEEA
jgi:hypothetical protein